MAIVCGVAQFKILYYISILYINSWLVVIVPSLRPFSIEDRDR